jgi:hypothetical protein
LSKTNQLCIQSQFFTTRHAMDAQLLTSSCSMSGCDTAATAEGVVPAAAATRHKPTSKPSRLDKLFNPESSIAIL